MLLLRAAEHSLSAAVAPQAVRWMAETGDDDSPTATYLRGRLALIRGDVEDAQVLLTTAYRAATASHDQGTAARSAQQLAWLALDRGQAADVIQWASVATDDDDPALARAGRGLLALGQTIAGHGPQALAALPPLPRQLSVHDLELATVRGTLRLYTDDLVGARSDLRSALRVMGTDSYHLAFPVHANLAEVEQRAGNWDAAVFHGQLAVSAIDDVEQLWLRAATLALAVTAPARRGQWDDAKRLSQARRAPRRRWGTCSGAPTPRRRPPACPTAGATGRGRGRHRGPRGAARAGGRRSW